MAVGFGAVAGVAPALAHPAPSAAPVPNPAAARMPHGVGGAAASDPTTNSIAGTTEIADTDLWSVGYGSDDQSNVKPVTYHGDGTSWHQIACPTPKNTLWEFVFGVSGTASNDVWTVGSWSPDLSNWYPTAAHWNGTAWKVVPVPHTTGHNYSVLYGVRAFAPDDVWAAGLQQTPGAASRTALVEHWDGTKWHIVATPAVAGAPTVSLTAISGTSDNDIWVAGWSQDAKLKVSPLAEHWNGTKWTIVSTASPAGGRSAQLTSVQQNGPHDVWAAGFSFDTPSGDAASERDRTLIEHWNGTSWSIVASPDASAPNSSLWGLTTVGPNSVWAVGHSNLDDQDSTTSTLAEHWNGTRWTIAATPNVAQASNYLATAVAVSPSKVWAAGVTASPKLGGQIPLFERWNGTSWQLRHVS